MSLTSAGVVDVTISGAGGTVTGSGASGQVTLWTAASVLAGNSGFTWAGTDATFQIQIASGMVLDGYGAYTGTGLYFGSLSGTGISTAGEGLYQSSGAALPIGTAVGLISFYPADTKILNISTSALYPQGASFDLGLAGNPWRDGHFSRVVRTANANISSLAAYADNAAALLGGLVAGDLYVVAASNPRQVAVVF